MKVITVRDTATEAWSEVSLSEELWENNEYEAAFQYLKKSLKEKNELKAIIEAKRQQKTTTKTDKTC